MKRKTAKHEILARAKIHSGAISEQELLYEIFYMTIEHIFVNLLEQNI